MEAGSGGANEARRGGDTGHDEAGWVPVPINIDEPRWEQNTFLGRLNRFIRITNPLLLLKSSRDFDDAAKLVQQAREGYVPKGTTLPQLYKAKVIYDSAFHPDSGKRMYGLGTMCAQVPGGMVITGILLAYYKTTLEVFLGQWLNQSFNAFVNYTNRNAKSQITNKQIAVSYVSATTGAVAVSVGMNSLVKRAPPVVKRWVPFTAVAVANCINIPLMRQRELINGIAVTDNEGNILGKSRASLASCFLLLQLAAAKGIAQVCFSRIFMAAPGMLLVPVLMERLERYPFFRCGKAFSAVLQTLFVGCFLTFTIPTGCALFPQQSSMATTRLEKSLQREIRSKCTVVPERVYFNKGL